MSQIKHGLAKKATIEGGQHPAFHSNLLIVLLNQCRLNPSMWASVGARWSAASESSLRDALSFNDRWITVVWNLTIERLPRVRFPKEPGCGSVNFAESCLVTSLITLSHTLPWYDATYEAKSRNGRLTVDPAIYLKPVLIQTLKHRNGEFFSANLI